MHISILLMEQIIELFIIILMGFIIVKAGIVIAQLVKEILFMCGQLVVVRDTQAV